MQRSISHTPAAFVCATSSLKQKENEARMPKSQGYGFNFDRRDVGCIIGSSECGQTAFKA